MKSVTTTKSAATTQLAAVLAAVLVGGLAAGTAHAAPAQTDLAGEIERITLDNPADYWTGGKIVVGGQTVILPKNLLLDLPANRLTLWQLVDQAPEPCKSRGETGLAKGDTCNVSGTGGIATLTANRTNAGNIIAGDVLIAKGAEWVTGKVTFINHTDGYIRIDGEPGVDVGGTLARMNDPSSRHTIQMGLGCAAGVDNCSPDARFGLDTDNYTNTSVNGFPMCLPSTAPRAAWGALTPGGGLPQMGTANTFDFSPAVSGTAFQGNADGTGDTLCPSTNRTPDFVVADARRFAPIQVGDNIEVEGNWETIVDANANRVRFLSFHTSTVHTALGTRSNLTQPDYFMPAEVFVEGPSFQNFRARSLLIGFSTLPPDILWWTLHYDPITGTKHEKPFASVAGCDTAAGAGNCGLVAALGAPNQGPAGGNIFRIRYDIDFVIGAKVDLDPCAQIRAEPRFGATSTFCPNWVTTGKPQLYNAQAIAEMFAILSPMPHEMQARTGHALAAAKAGYDLKTVDINGQVATNGQYLYPLGMNLGGIELAEMTEINVNNLQMAKPFSGIPWNLDRRLSPNGCKRDANDVPVCEGTPQPLIPFPYEGYDPREQTTGCGVGAGGNCEVPIAGYNDKNFTFAPLTRVRDRVLSYMTRIGTTTPARYDFAGNASLLAWPPVDPAGTAISATPTVEYCVSEAGNCLIPPPAPVCATGQVVLNGSCVVPVPDCTAGQVLENNVCVNPTLTCGTGQTVSNGFCVATVPTCSATQTLQNNVCVNNAPVCVSPQVLSASNVCVTPDTLTVPRITWAGPERGGIRGLSLVAKSSTAAANLTVTANAGTTRVLVPTALTRVTVNQGTVTCTLLSPCWVLPVTRTVLDTKPTAVIITSDRLGKITLTSPPNF